jgi:hypothetical protein
MTRILMTSAMLLLLAATAQADGITCKGSITSVQGEGLVNRKHRFEVAGVTGDDLAAVLDKCRKIAQERQSRAVRSSPFGNFKKFSDLDLECVRGSEKFQMRRSLQTGP